MTAHHRGPGHRFTVEIARSEASMRKADEPVDARARPRMNFLRDTRQHFYEIIVIPLDIILCSKMARSRRIEANSTPVAQPALQANPSTRADLARRTAASVAHRRRQGGVAALAA